MFKKLPSLKIINKLFYYKGGRLYYAINRSTWVRPGMEAGCLHKNSGYQSVKIGDERFQSHRIIWKMFHKKEPMGEIDHIDGNRSNNKIENLRLVRKCDNLKNQRLYKNNRSGAHGVYWSKQKKKWCVQLTSGGEQMYYGCFSKLDDAKRKRAEIQRSFDFHENHGQ